MIDVHMHIGKLYIGERTLTPSYLLRFMDAYGIEKAALLPIESPEETHYYVTTEYVLHIAKRHPDRFIPFCNVDPRRGAADTSTDFFTILEDYAQRGCRGYGEAMSGLFIDDARLMKIYEACGELGLPVLFHMDGKRSRDDKGLPRLERVLQRFPKTIFIGHAQHFWAEISSKVSQRDFSRYPKGKIAPGGAVVRLLRAYPNLYADISAGSGYNALTRDPAFGYAFVEQFQEKLLFGTDLCRYGQEIPIISYLKNALARGYISQTAYERITRENAVKLLHLDEG